MEPDWTPLPLEELERLFDFDAEVWDVRSSVPDVAPVEWFDDLPPTAGARPAPAPVWAFDNLPPRSDSSAGCPQPSPVAVPTPCPEPVRWAIPGVHPDETAGAAAGSVASASPSAAMLAVQQAVEAYCAQDPVLLDPAQALADAQVLVRVEDRLRVQTMTVLADVAARQLHELAGARSAAAWHRQVAPDADPTDLSFGTKVRPHRTLHAAVEAGRVSIKAGKKVLRVLRQCGPHVDRLDGLIDGQPSQQVMDAVIGNVVTLVAQSRMGLADDDPLLTDLVDKTEQIAASGTSELDRLEQAFTLLAQHAPLGMLSGMLEELFLAIVPSELERRAREARDRRDLTVTTLPDQAGMDIRIRTDIPCGERFLTALRSELRRDRANPLDTALAEALRAQGVDPYSAEAAQQLAAQGNMEGAGLDVAGTHPDGLDGALADPDFGLPRGRGRRMHDALDRLLTRYLEHGLGGVHQKVPVQVNITLTDQALTGRPGALPAKGESGQPIPRSLLRRWFSDSRVTAFVLSIGGQALRTTHLGRTLTARERQALLIQQGHRCAGIGCCRGSTRAGPDPTIDLRPHHVHGYAIDGTTSFEETVMFCDTSHHDIHEGKKTIRLRDGRYLNERGWVTPDQLTPPDAPF